MSPKIASALAALFEGQHQVESIKSMFGRTNVTDVEWLGELSRSGASWVVISGDRRITRSPAEKAAFKQSKAIGFFLSPALQKSPVIRQTARLLTLWSTIETTAQQMQPGSMFELPEKSTKLRPIG